MTAKPRFGFALEYVSDIEEAKRFYTDVLGLEVARESPVFVQFKDESGSHFAIASDEPMGASGAPELYWLVDDAEAAFNDLSARGEISRPFEQMPFEGFRHQRPRRPAPLSGRVRPGSTESARGVIRKAMPAGGRRSAVAAALSVVPV